MTAALGLDVGGGSSRWVLVDGSGRELRRGTAPPLTGHLFRADARAEAEAALDALAGTLSGSPVAAIVAGVTGVVEGSPEVAGLARALARRFGIAPGLVTVGDDQRLAYHAAFAPGEGILVYGGTGSFACHVDVAGVAHRAGGRGYVLGDGGSGFWIGRTALAWLVDAMDATDAWPDGALADGLAAAVGGRTWSSVRDRVYAEPRRHVAALAPVVAAAADAGDAVAGGVLDEAGRRLAQLALRLGGRVGRLPCGLAGAAALGHDRIFAAFAGALAAGWPDAPDIRRGGGAAAETAARLAAAKLAAAGG